MGDQIALLHLINKMVNENSSQERKKLGIKLRADFHDLYVKQRKIIYRLQEQLDMIEACNHDEIG